MKKFLNIFFVTLGVIFFVLILAAGYLFITDPFNLKPLFINPDQKAVQSAGDGIDKHPVFNESQEEALESFGVDPAALPSEITSEQENCFEEKLGASRVEEIKAVDSPTMADFLKAKSCI